MEHVGCASTDLKKKHKNTQNTWPVHLFFLMLKKNTKTRKIQRGLPLCCLGLTTLLHLNPKNTKEINPTKQVFSIAFLHIYTRVLKSTKIHNGWQFFSLVFMVKKTQNYIKHKRHIWSFSDLQRAISIRTSDCKNASLIQLVNISDRKKNNSCCCHRGVIVKVKGVIGL